MRDLLFIKKQALRPNKLTFYNEVLLRDGDNLRLLTERKKKFVDFHGKDVKITSIAVEKKFHDFKISINAQRKIEEKITWLYQLARSRAVISQSGKQILNFKMCFFTLTLPSKQTHNTAFLHSECLNHFITEIRDVYKMENYVWRLEFQSNGNAHWHFATDTFIDYKNLNEIWNRIITKLGYVQAYRDKMSAMSLSDYVREYSRNGQNDFKTLAQRYYKGKGSGWSQPPTVDVKSCTSGKSIAVYISKYFGKKDKSGCDRNEMDTEENSFAIRLWFCSRSLSKLEKIAEYVDNCNVCFKTLFTAVVNAKHIVCKYVDIVYYNYNECSMYVKGVLSQLFRNYAISLGYSSA